MNASRSPKKDRNRDHRTAPFFALRTPLLPFDVLAEWTRSLGGHDSIADPAEHSVRRSWLAARLADGRIREALFLASPSLEAEIPAWEQAPDSERGRRIEGALVRYLLRMAHRCTPFGLFAAHSVAYWGPNTQLDLGEALRRSTRLDMDYLCGLVDAVASAEEVRHELRYVANSSLYRLGDRWHYLEPRSRGVDRTYDLAALEPSPHFDVTIERARHPATIAELSDALLRGQPDLEREEVDAFISQLIDEKVLLPTWLPRLTGGNPVTRLLAEAQGVKSLTTVRSQLADVQAQLEAMDTAPQPQAPAAYRAIAEGLGKLPFPAELGRLFQVDLFRGAADVRLPHHVADALYAGAELLYRIMPPAADPLEPLRARFVARFEDREVPLMEALDEDTGILPELVDRWQGDLLDGIDLSPAETGAPLAHGPREEHWLRLLETCWRRGGASLDLTEADLIALAPPKPRALPDFLGVLGTIAAADAAAIDRGDFEVAVSGAHANPARYLGRFSHGDPALEQALQAILRREERLRPDVVFAEIIHLPEERSGNVVLRARLREHEIVFLGEASAPPEFRLSIEDLTLSVRRGRWVLRSRRLGRQIVPRLSCAHNYRGLGVRLYRILCQLQHQDGESARFDWGPLEGATHLPRVRCGRTVLSLARWRIPENLLTEWAVRRGADRYTAIQAFRRERQLPRWLHVDLGDQGIPIDLDNPFAIDAMVATLHGKPQAILTELYPDGSRMPFFSRAGHHAHEIHVAFLREASTIPAPDPRRPLAREGVRRCPPGSDWLYLKVYSGGATLDRLLVEDLGDAIDTVLASGAVTAWHFIRYADPNHHLRLRFAGDPARLEAEVWPILSAAARSAIERGAAHALERNTFEREIERYGGPEGIVVVEQVFSADSAAVLDLLRERPSDEERWRLALVGVDGLLDDLGLSLVEKIELTDSMAQSYAKEHRFSAAHLAQIGARYRREASAVLALLQSPSSTLSTHSWAALARRSEQVRSATVHLGELDAAGELNQSVASIARSIVHMHANRMFVYHPRTQEMVIMNFLARAYRTQAALRRVAR